MFSSYFFFVAGWGPLHSFAVERTLLCWGGLFAAVRVCCERTAGATCGNLNDGVIHLHVFTESLLNLNLSQTKGNHRDHWLISFIKKKSKANLSERVCSHLLFIRLSSVFSLPVFKGPSSLCRSFYCVKWNWLLFLWWAVAQSCRALANTDDEGELETCLTCPDAFWLSALL